MILSDGTLHARLNELIVEHADHALVNPASIDIRVGETGKIEILSDKFVHIEFSLYTAEHPYWLYPGDFVLIATLENFNVPLDCAMELKLKSSRAREGYNHSLAFWFDPGWSGIGTMEIHNITKYSRLPLYRGLRIAQIIYHQLDHQALVPYSGRYQGATLVEESKP